MKKILAFVMVAVISAAVLASDVYQGTQEWIVSVAPGGSSEGTGMRLVGNATHVRAYVATSEDIRMYGITFVRDSAGRPTGDVLRRPFGESSRYPDASSNFWTLAPSTVEPWNEYANVKVDSLFIYSVASSGAVNVKLQAIFGE